MFICSKETNPKNRNEEKFLDRKDNEWSWNVHEFADYWQKEVGENHAQISYLYFAEDGEPLLHPITAFKTVEQRKRVLQRFFTTHYSRPLIHITFRAPC